MTRDKLIEFLQNNYEPDEQLVWQTITFTDVESVDGSTEELWSKFVREQDHYSSLAEMFGEDAFNEFYVFVEKLKKESK